MIDIYLTVLISLIASLSFTIDSAQIAIKLKAAEFNSAILGSHVSQVLLLINRALVALSLLIIGFLVDRKYGISNLILIYSFTAFLTSIFHFFILNSTIIQKLTLYLLRLIHKKDVSLNNINRTYKSNFEFWPTLSLVTVLTFLGFFGPSIFAVSFYDYRATLMQTSFIINTAATLVYVLIIEKRMAIIMELSDDTLIKNLSQKFLYTRTVSFLCLSLFLIVFFFLIK